MTLPGSVPSVFSGQTDQLSSVLSAALNPTLGNVIGMTREMFPGSAPEIETVADPEDAAHPFLMVTVQWAGDPRDSVEKRLEWHRRIARLGGGKTPGIRLSIVCP
jgi:hypothetical protein